MWDFVGPLRWRHNGRDCVSNHQPHHCSLNRYLDADQRKHQSSASLAFVWGIHRGPVNSPQKWPVARKMFPFDGVIMHVAYCQMAAQREVVMGYELDVTSNRLHWVVTVLIITQTSVCDESRVGVNSGVGVGVGFNSNSNSGVGVGIGVETSGFGVGVGVDILEICRSWSWSWNSWSWSWNWNWNSWELELELKFCQLFFYSCIIWNIWLWKLGPSGNKPLSEPMLTQVDVAMWHQYSLAYSSGYICRGRLRMQAKIVAVSLLFVKVHLLTR